IHFHASWPGLSRSSIRSGAWVPGSSPGTTIAESAHSAGPYLSPVRPLLQSDCPLLPPVIGHRGAAARAPENTLAGLRCAKELGCAWVEFDVRLTGDGALVLCHDSRLDRTTTGRGRVAAQPLAAIRGCDAGSWFHPDFAGEV